VVASHHIEDLPGLTGHSGRGHATPEGYAAFGPCGLTLDHLKLVRRDVREVKKFRTWVLSALPGAVGRTRTPSCMR
jgi:hypothetical protein